MRLSPTTGKILSGQGGGTIGIDGAVPASLATATGGGWGWLDDDTCGGQADLGAGYLLRKLIVSTDTLSVLDATPSGVTDAATQFRAGNNFWAAFLTGGALKGVRSNIRATLPMAALGDLDETGRMVVVQNYSADAGLVCYNTIGAQLWINSTTVLDGSNRLRSKNGSVAYQDTSSNWHLRDTATGVLQSFAPRTGEVVAAMVPVLISSVIWVVELTGTQLTIRPATSSNGFVLSTSANLFNPDAVSMSAGTVRVGWSVTTGENPTDIRIADLTVTTGGTALGSTTTGSLVIGSSTAGTTGNFTVGPVEGGSLQATKQPRLAMKPDGSGFVGSAGARQYQAWWDTLAGQAVAPANLSQATGILDPGHGGTGTDTGLTVIDGGNILPGTIPATAMGWYWSPLTDGDVPQTELIFANGDTIMVAQMRTP